MTARRFKLGGEPSRPESSAPEALAHWESGLPVQLSRLLPGMTSTSTIPATLPFPRHFYPALRPAEKPR